MLTRLSNLVSGRHKTFWRIVWILVLLLHVPATVSTVSAAWRGDGGAAAWSTILFLLVSNFFFIQEIAFASSMRLISNRRAAVVFILVVVLLHAGAIEQSVPGLLDVPEARFWLAASAVGAMAWLILRRIRVAGLAMAFCDAAELQRQLARSRYGGSVPPVLAICRPICGWHRVPPRAPPMP